MIELTPSQTADLLGGSFEPEASSGPDPSLTVAVIDSRKVTAGSLFVALPGEHVDGHDYVRAAHEAGSGAALVSRHVPGAGPQIVVADPAAALGVLAREHVSQLRESAAADGRPFDVVGVTGSVGKTTTKDLLAALLADLGGVVAPVESFNNEIGLPLTVLQAGPDTRTLVLEMGADAPGNLTYLTSIAAPDIAIVLKVGHAHLQSLGSVEGVARAKAELVQGLRPGGVALLNIDDPNVAPMAALTEHVRFFGESDRAEFRALDVHTDSGGHASFVLAEQDSPNRDGPNRDGPNPDSRTPVRLGLVGEHHVLNALAAAAAARLLGMDTAVIAERLATAGPASAHRMHVVDTPGGIRVIDDAYNANPESMRAALTTLAGVAAGRPADPDSPRRRSVAVLGEMRELGENAIAEHDGIGRLVARLSIDKLLAVGPGARAIHSGACQEGSRGEEVHFVATTQEAMVFLRGELRAGDVVLLKSSNGAGLARLADELIGELTDHRPAEAS